MSLFHVIGLCVYLIMGLLPVQAHQTRPAIITVTFLNNASVKIRIETNAESLVAGIGSQHDNTDNAPEVEVYRELRLLSPVDLSIKFRDFADEFKSGLNLQLSEQNVNWRYYGIEVPAVGDTRVSRKSVITYLADIPVGATSAIWSYAPKYGDAVVNFISDGQTGKTSFWLVKGQQSPEYALESKVIPRSGYEVAMDYTQLGFLHILPRGLDHILFVLGLFLLNRRLRPLLWQVTAFTLAHSITLALSIYGYINLSAAIVEPLIAVSIAYVGIENIITKQLKPWRVVIVFLFGLLHGMGFAGVLTELELPESEFITALITFNVGVELGQLSVILLAWLAVFRVRKREILYRQLIVIPGSLLIALMGFYWTWERIG